MHEILKNLINLKRNLCKLHSVLAFTYPILHFNGYLLLVIRYGRVILIYMATPDEDSTGVSIPKRGRPSLGEKICRIGLRESVYNRWLIKKEEAGYKDKSNSEFAEFLLKVFNYDRRSGSPTASEIPSSYADMGKTVVYIMFVFLQYKL